MSLDYDREQVTDAIEFRRKRMERQVAADEIKGELCNYIREQQTSSVKKKLGVLSRMEGFEDLYTYIRKIELINNSIYCIKCDANKHVPGFNETNIVTIANPEGASADPTATDHLETAKVFAKTIMRKLEQVETAAREIHTQYTKEIAEVNSYYENVTNEINKFRQTVGIPVREMYTSDNIKNHRVTFRQKPETKEMNNFRPMSDNIADAYDDIGQYIDTTEL